MPSATITTNAQGFEGIVDHLAPDIPVPTVGNPQNRGFPIFFNIDTGEVVRFDPWLLKEEGRIGAPALMVLANRGHGKTTLNQLLAMTFSARRGYLGGLFRVAGDDHRDSAGRPEYLRLAEDLGVEEVKLDEYELNCLDYAMGLTFSQQFGMMKRLLRHAFGREFRPRAHSEPLSYGLQILRRDFPKTAELKLLAMVLRGMGDTDAKELIFADRDEMYARHADDPMYHKWAARPVRINKRFRENAVELAAMIEELLKGEYGKILGGKASLAEVMQRRFVIFDYSGLDDEAVMLVQSMMWYWRAAALANRDMRFRFDMEFHDENYKMWAFEVYAYAMHRLLKQLRSRSTFVVLSTHRLSDYETVGSKNSKLYKLAMNSIREIDIFLIGALDRGSAEEAGQFLQLTQEEVLRIQRLKRGQWGLKIGNERIVWVQADLTDRLKEITYSDDANRNMLVA